MSKARHSIINDTGKQTDDCFWCVFSLPARCNDTQTHGLYIRRVGRTVAWTPTSTCCSNVVWRCVCHQPRPVMSCWCGEQWSAAAALSTDLVPPHTNTPHICLNETIPPTPSLQYGTSKTKRSRTRPQDQTFETQPTRPSLQNHTSKSEPPRPHFKDGTSKAEPPRPNPQDQTSKTEPPRLSLQDRTSKTWTFKTKPQD